MEMDSKQASPPDRSNPSIQKLEKLDADLSPVPPIQRSSSLAQLPSFPTLTGEYPVLISKTADGSAMVTNFRFYACEQRSFINIPLMMVAELIVIEAAKRLRIGSKDGATYSCTFATIQDLTACYASLKEKTGLPPSKQTLFAYRFYEEAMLRKEQNSGLTKLEKEHIQLCEPVDSKFAYSFGKEVKRLGFDTNKEKIWRMCHANDNFEFCPTYPKIHILPETVDDDKLKVSLDFRAMKRFPSVVWRDRRTGMVLIRSSQPLSSFLGVSYFTNQSDVFLIEEIVNACNKDWKLIIQNQKEQSKSVRALPDSRANSSPDQEGGQEFRAHKGDGAQGSLVCDDPAGANDHGASNGNYYYDDGLIPKKLAIVDCRSLAGVWGNSFKGGGTEDEVVYNCNIVHLDLANIHTVRDSFNKLRALCHGYVEGTFYKNLAGCMWLTYISALLRGANIVVEQMHKMRRPVLVHCSDGWDRTSQIVSLSELMMDPYYRTLEGFQVLVEREWLHFGHKFGERGGHDPNCSDTSQISPIFLQFLDCVHQLTLQYPAEFQFSEAYLVKLLQNSQSCLFGNFLYNCQKERENCSQKTASVWSLLKPERTQFVNLLYRPSDRVLTAKVSEHDIVLWKSVYMAGLSPMLHLSQTDFGHELAQLGGGEETSNPATEGIPRSKSVDDMSKISVDSGRRNSDPNITQSQELVSVSPPATHSLHDDPLSLHPRHLQEDPPGLTKTESSPVQSHECVEDGPQLVNGTSASIQHSDSQHLFCSTDILDKLQVECATISPSPDTVSLSQDTIYMNGHDWDNESLSIREVGPVFLSEDSGAHSLEASSSAVFCQEDGWPVSSSEQILCCDSHMVSTDPQVLSERTTLSTFSGSPCAAITRRNGRCSKICGKLVDNFASRTNSSLTYDSGCGPATSLGSSLVSERVALSSDVELMQNGKAETMNCCMTNGTVVGHLNGDDRNHSMKSEELQHIGASLKAQAYQEVSRKLQETSGHLNGHYIDESRMCKPVIKAGNSEPKCYFDTMVPKKLLNCPQLVNLDCSRSSINSISTDTLNGDLDPGNDVISPPPYSKPLEVTTLAYDDKLTVAIPVKSALALHSSSAMKVGGYSSEINDISGSNLVSRRARAASGASRDLSVSPCACRRQLSDAGHLLYPSGSELISRRILGATVATSTTDISDSHVAQLRQPSISQHIDIDGLTIFCDERQGLLAQLIAEKDRKIEELRFQLSQALIEMSRGFIAHQQQPQTALLDDQVNDSDGGELGSLGALSNASDASWEAVDKTEAEIIMWVPDSAVTHCAGCSVEFRMYIRKHHCRNCGKVFCHNCSDKLAPVPHQHLNYPERVCRRCHSHLIQLSPGASSDGRIPTLVANG